MSCNVYYRFPTLFSFSSSPLELSNLEDEFLSYQLLNESDIPDSVWKSALVVEKDDKQYYRMDVIWAYLKTVKHADNSLVFKKLADVALLVLTLPHSNAEEERVFSLVTKKQDQVPSQPKPRWHFVQHHHCQIGQ